jgi:hypothetical protein
MSQFPASFAALDNHLHLSGESYSKSYLFNGLVASSRNQVIGIPFSSSASQIKVGKGLDIGPMELTTFARVL